jgi:hypothetical protein
MHAFAQVTYFTHAGQEYQRTTKSDGDTVDKLVSDLGDDHKQSLQYRMHHPDKSLFRYPKRKKDGDSDVAPLHSLLPKE